MRCSRCDMPLSPAKTSCPRCGTAVASGSFKEQGERPFAFVQASAYQGQQNNSSVIGTAVDVAPAQYNWVPQAKSVLETPFATVLPSPQTPLTSRLEDAQAATHIQDAQAFSTLSPLPKADNRSAGMGFGLAGLCTVLACLLLLFVYVIAQTLPPPDGSSSTRLANKSSLVAQNTPMIDLSSTATTPAVSPTATYPGQQYIANAQTATAINVVTAQPTLPTSTFTVGQKIYITFDVHPNGHTGAICLLWFINATQFASYPFALNTTNTTSAYSYAATRNAGPGYVEIYWENAPSCIDPNKVLSDHIDFTVTAA